MAHAFHERLLDAPPWDLLIVDEAHHLNADQDTGKTLGFRLVEQLVGEARVGSCLFFTGTPHRGKPYGFWSLMGLLQPDAFSPSRPEAEQLPLLRQSLIRNFKQKVTDMSGRRLFQPVVNRPETYSYAEAETTFYRDLTCFILAGNAYASGLDRTGQRQVALVLIAMQKIASSSVAAIRAALRKRLATIQGEMQRYQGQRSGPPEAEMTVGEDEDLIAAWERWSREAKFKLMADELPRLQALLSAAEGIDEESKIRRIAEIVETRFADRSVLLFTGW